MLQRRTDLLGTTSPVFLHEDELNDIVREINQQQDGTQNLGALTLASYGTKQIDITKPDSTSGSTKYFELFRHNLGYRPICLVWYFSPVDSLYEPMPTLFTAAAVDIVIATNIAFTTDTSSLYATWMGQAQQPQQQFYYFVFNNPASK